MDNNKFSGKPCVVCASTIRYKSQSQCVKCTNKSNKKFSRKVSDQKLYGTSVDVDKTERRRAAEDRLIEKELGL